MIGPCDVEGQIVYLRVRDKNVVGERHAQTAGAFRRTNLPLDHARSPSAAQPICAVVAPSKRRNLAYSSLQDLRARPEVRRLIGEEIVHRNASLPAAARIRRFLLLNKEFDADDNEITRTRKAARGADRARRARGVRQAPSTCRAFRRLRRQIGVSSRGG
jgi:hypothetical protein